MSDRFDDRNAAPPVTLLDAVLRTNLPAFVQKVFGTVSAGDRYAPNWHIRAICHELEKVMRGNPAPHHHHPAAPSQIDLRIGGVSSVGARP
ncbi:MAG: hypothetical protein WAK55_04375 [Xanthobacteraceae bacterium]